MEKGTWSVIDVFLLKRSLSISLGNFKQRPVDGGRGPPDRTSDAGISWRSALAVHPENRGRPIKEGKKVRRRKKARCLSQACTGPVKP